MISETNMQLQYSGRTAGPYDSHNNQHHPSDNITNAEKLIHTYKNYGALGITAMVLLGVGNPQQAVSSTLGKVWPRAAELARKYPKVTWTIGGFVAVCSFAKFVPGIAQSTWRWLMDHVLANVTIERDDKAQHDSIMALITSKKDLSNQRSLVAYSADYLKNKKGATLLNNEKIVYQGHLGRMQMFSHNGNRFVFTIEEPPQSNKEGEDEGTNNGNIKIWRFDTTRTHPWWSPQPIKNLINQVIDETEEAKRATEIKVFKASQYYWESQAPCMYRSLESVSLDSAMKNKLIDDLDDFLHPDAAQWHQERGIEYRRGYLFYGKPGCGKTSMVRAIASHWGLNIYTLSLQDKDINDTALLELFSKLSKGDIILLEDIDCAGLLDRAAQRKMEMQRPKMIQHEDGTVDDLSDHDEPTTSNHATRKSKKRKVELAKTKKHMSPSSQSHNNTEDGWGFEAENHADANSTP